MEGTLHFCVHSSTEQSTCRLLLMDFVGANIDKHQELKSMASNFGNDKFKFVEPNQ